MKKVVQFPSEVRHMASEKEKLDDIKRSMRQTKNRMKISIAVNENGIEEKKSKRTKNINQDYLDALKGTKNKSKLSSPRNSKDESYVE